MRVERSAVPRNTATTRREAWPISAHAHWHSTQEDARYSVMRRGFCTLMLFIGSVFLCVCVSVKSRLTYGTSVRPENAVTYSAGNEGQKICGICLKRLRSRVMQRNMSEKANMLIRLTRGQLSPLDTQRSAR